jgi:hypothetical protein
MTTAKQVPDPNAAQNHNNRRDSASPRSLKAMFSMSRKPSRPLADSSSACTDGVFPAATTATCQSSSSFKQTNNNNNNNAMRSPAAVSSSTACSQKGRPRSGTPISPQMFLKRRSFITSDKLVKTLKRDSGIRRRFESFAANQFASEGVTFLKGVMEWKAETPGEAEEAMRLCETYVFEGSPLQINISWSARTNIERKLQQGMKADGMVQLELFDEASNEVASMMVEGGIWGSFVWKGGCDSAASQDSSNDEGSVLDEPRQKDVNKVSSETQLALT